MPKNYADEILGQDLEDLVQFLIDWTSNAGSASGGGN